MRGKVEERSINESSSNSDPQTIQSNPYGKTNVSQQQQQVINNEAPESEPPPYVAVVQPSSNFQPQSEYVVQSKLFSFIEINHHHLSLRFFIK
jgi:hypothetical protein